jgi:drug/metabolite transporter (DMT)-like permease
MNLIGELAALATSFLFALTALIFTVTRRRVGSQGTNRMRLTFALIYLIILSGIFALALAKPFRGHRPVTRRRVPFSITCLDRTASWHAVVKPRADFWFNHCMDLLW